MSRRIRRQGAATTALIAILGAGLAACTTVGPNFQPPEAPKAGGYAMAGDRATPVAVLTPEQRVLGPWWRALGDPQLDAVMTQALADNQTVAEAEANLAKAREQATGVEGSLKPQVDAKANAARERINIQSFGFTGFPNPTINLFSIGGDVSYDLDLFGGGRRSVEEARARVDLQGERADAAYLSLTGNVAMQAVRIAVLREQIATVQAIVADDRTNIDIIRKAEAAGGEPQSATVGGRAQLAADLALLPPLNQQLAEARHALAALVGKAPAEWSAPDFALAGFVAPASVPVSLPSDLVRRRPDILAAEADLHAATADIGVQTAKLYPDVRLTADLTQSALTPDKLFSWDATGYTLAAGVTAPVFHGGTLKANRRAAEAEARASLARYRQTVLTAFTQVADVLSALANDDERLKAVALAQSTAEANLKDARSAYTIGGGPYVDIITAQRRLNTVRRDLLDAQAQRLGDMVKLFTATAADWREDKTAAG
ncbi:efflux transporter outer membrane subunit [Caulobacter sp. KR2-114]|uniref:efflux transporter outer membrane subunit n=1 Tax=Caulobacter sp. KR2-114 TaxID=3400912 RepID=UPI003C07F1BB